MALKANYMIGLMVFVLGQAAGAKPIYYDCDTPSGSYSEIRFNQNQTAYRVRGTITAMELRPNASWRPTATVYVKSQDKRYSADVQLMNNEARTLDLTIGIGENGQYRKTSIGRLRNKGSISFDLYIPTIGQAFAEVSGKKVPLGVNLGTNAQVSITCSSGHFRFDPLDWDWQPLP
jgi:hypothetical protein